MTLFVPCNRGAPYDGNYRSEDQCRLCWLYFNDGKDPVAYGFRPHYDRHPPAGHHEGDPPPPPASMGQKVLNWAQDTAKWVAAGRPEVTDAEAEARHAVCKTNECGAYDKGKDTCLACGCPLHSTLFGNKLKRATSECPKGLWNATADNVPTDEG